jgi:hypothetical protein
VEEGRATDINKTVATWRVLIPAMVTAVSGAPEKVRRFFV